MDYDYDLPRLTWQQATCVGVWSHFALELLSKFL